MPIVEYLKQTLLMHPLSVVVVVVVVVVEGGGSKNLFNMQNSQH